MKELRPVERQLIDQTINQEMVRDAVSSINEQMQQIRHRSGDFIMEDIHLSAQEFNAVRRKLPGLGSRLYFETLPEGTSVTVLAKKYVKKI